MVGQPARVAQGRPQIATPLEVGAPAPDFTLPDQYGSPTRLGEELRSTVVVLVFFPAAFTPTCTAELQAIRDDPAAFSSAGVTTVGISCDGGPALKAYAAAEGIGYPLLSDFWPHGEVARSYGVLVAERGIARRATFVVGRDGLIAWSVLSAPEQARDAAELRTALASLAGHRDL